MFDFFLLFLIYGLFFLHCVAISKITSDTEIGYYETCILSNTITLIILGALSIIFLKFSPLVATAYFLIFLLLMVLTRGLYIVIKRAYNKIRTHFRPEKSPEAESTFLAIQEAEKINYLKD